MSASPGGSDQPTAQLRAVLTLVESTLGEELVGAYLHGSAVSGGMVPTSDIDLLAVTSRRPTGARRRRLTRELLSLSVPTYSPLHGRPDARPIELTIVVQAAVKPWRYPPEMEYQYGDWLREEFAAGKLPERTINPDLAVIIELVRRHGRALLGPPAGNVFEPIPRADLVAAMIDGVDGLLSDFPGDQRNVILTLARIWMTLDTGDIGRKDAAAAWAAQRLPPEQAAVLERARELYIGGRYGPWGESEGQVAEAAHYLAEQVR